VHIGNFGLAQRGFHAVWANPQAVGSMTLKNSTISETFNVGISYTNSTYALLSTVTSQLNAVLVGTPDGGH
jgi:hypothetical protein